MARKPPTQTWADHIHVLLGPKPAPCQRTGEFCQRIADLPSPESLREVERSDEYMGAPRVLRRAMFRARQRQLKKMRRSAA